MRKEVVEASQKLLGIGSCSVVTTNNGWQTGDTFLTWAKENIGSEKNPMFVIDLFAAHRDGRVIG